MPSDTDTLTVVPRFTRSTVYPIVWSGLFVASLFVLLGVVSLLPGIERVFGLLSLSVGTAVFVTGTLVVSGVLIVLAPHVAAVVEQSLDGPDDVVADGAVSARAGLVFGGLVLADWGLTPVVSGSLPASLEGVYHSGFAVVVVSLGAYALWRGREVLVELASPHPDLSPRTSPASTRPVAQRSTATNPVENRPITDTERVEKLLESRDGRMRQADIADELDWSASKTSRVLSEMADEGKIEKLRLGRENLIELADDQ